MTTTTYFCDFSEYHLFLCGFLKQQLISRELPENVNLLTLENRSDGSYLIRLEHIYDVGEDKILSKPVTVSLQVNISIFNYFIETV
jgi:hypothetical protein